MRNIFLFSAVLVFLASCGKKEFSPDEPFAPVVKPNLYIVSEGNILYALDPATGGTRWKYFQDSPMRYEPVPLGDYVFVNHPHNVYKLSAIDGSVLDSFPSIDPQTGITTIMGPVVGSGNYIYVPYLFNSSSVTSHYVKYDINDKNPSKTAVNNWDIPLPVNTALPNNTETVITMPTIFGNNILISYTTKLKLTSTQANADVWTKSLAAPNNPTTDGVNIFCTSGNTLTAYDYQTGNTLWTYLAPDIINTSPIIYGGNILFGCNDNRLYCIDSVAQQPRWSYLTDERIFSSPYAYDQTIYFGSNDHYFYAVNINDGSLKWRYRTGALIKSSPIAYNGTVYVGSYDQYLYAFDTSGVLKWKYLLNGLIDRSPVLYDPAISKSVYPAVDGMSVQ